MFLPGATIQRVPTELPLSVSYLSHEIEVKGAVYVSNEHFLDFAI